MSGVTWVPVRRVAKVLNGGTPSPDEENWNGDIPWATPVDLGQAHGKTFGSTLRTLTLRGASQGSQIVPAGSVVISSRAPIGYVSIASTDTALNQGCKALVLRSAWADPRFLSYATQSTVDKLISAGRGSTFLEVSAADVAAHPIPWVNAMQQRAIADYLDHETAEIDALVTELIRFEDVLTERLTSRHSALFGNAVTGDRPFALLGELTERDWRAGKEFSNDPLLSVSIERGVQVRTSDTTNQAASEDLSKYKRAFRGDIVINRMRAFQGALGASATTGLVSPDYAVLHPVGSSDSRYLAELMRSAPFVFEMTKRLRGIGGSDSSSVRTPRIAVHDLLRIGVALPPADTQISILEHWESALRSTTSTRTDLTRAIALAKERRAALITAAVTGQIDVTATHRPAAEQLADDIKELT